MTYKGTIANLESQGQKARVIPDGYGNLLTGWLNVHGSIKGSLRKGTEVVYAIFDDQSGIVLARMDGEVSE